MQLLLKAAVAAHVVARALLLVMLLLIPGPSTKEWCGRPIWRELSMPSGWEAAGGLTSRVRKARTRVPNRAFSPAAVTSFYCIGPEKGYLGTWRGCFWRTDRYQGAPHT